MPIVDRILSAFSRKAAAQTSPEKQPLAYRETAAGFSLLGGKDQSQPTANFDTLYYAVKKHSDTNAAVRYLMNGVGKSGYDFAATDGGDNPDEQQVAFTSEILESGPMSFRERIKATVLHTVAVGNYYWVILRNGAGDPIGISQIHPKTAVVVVDVYGEVKAYMQKMSGKAPIVFDPQDVVHFKDVIDPEDDVYGMGRLQALIASELASDQKAAEMNQKILDNDMKIPFIIRLPKDISQADFERISTWLRDSYQSWQNAGRPLLAPGVEGIETVAQSFSDMQFLELRRLSIEKVCSAIGVPKSVLGYRDSANEATAGKVDRITVYEDTIRPLEESISEKINRDLFPKLGVEDIRFEFNYSSSIEAETVNESTRRDLQLGVRTINELRYERGVEPLDAETYPLAATPMIYTSVGAVPLSDVTDVRSWTGPVPSAPDSIPVPVGSTIEELRDLGSLNGAQIQAALRIIAATTEGKIPRDAAIAQLQLLFGLSESEAERLLGSAGQADAEVTPNPVDEDAIADAEKAIAALSMKFL